jgi:hypothetical protein
MVERFLLDRSTAAAQAGRSPARHRDRAAVLPRRREFAHVRLVALFWNGLGVSDDEQGAQIFIATGLRSSWALAWPAFRRYS